MTALSYAELSGRIPKSAGEAAFTEAAFRRPALSFLIGWLVLSSGIVSMATVSRAFPGRALDVRLGGGRGAWVYRVKVLAADGTVVSVTVDARSGRIVGVRRPRH